MTNGLDGTGPRPFIQKSQRGERIPRLNFATHPLQMCVGYLDHFYSEMNVEAGELVRL